MSCFRLFPSKVCSFSVGKSRLLFVRSCKNFCLDEIRVPVLRPSFLYIRMCIFFFFFFGISSEIFQIFGFSVMSFFW